MRMLTTAIGTVLIRKWTDSLIDTGSEHNGGLSQVYPTVGPSLPASVSTLCLSMFRTLDAIGSGDYWPENSDRRQSSALINVGRRAKRVIARFHCQTMHEITIFVAAFSE